jgi:hypothetical protein
LKKIKRGEEEEKKKLHRERDTLILALRAAELRHT